MGAAAGRRWKLRHDAPQTGTSEDRLVSTGGHEGEQKKKNSNDWNDKGLT